MRTAYTVRGRPALDRAFGLGPGPVSPRCPGYSSEPRCGFSALRTYCVAGRESADSKHRNRETCVLLHLAFFRFCLPTQSTSGCTTLMCRVNASLREKVFSSVQRWHRTFIFRAL
jgi:hypothetical protein